MKNLPEKDFWNELRTRLSNYSEMPDDGDWDRIAGALPEAKSTSTGKRWAGIALIFLLGTSTGYLLHQFAPFRMDHEASLVTAVTSGGNARDKSRLSDGTAGSEENGEASVPVLRATDVASNQSDPADISAYGNDQEMSADGSEQEAVSEFALPATTKSTSEKMPKSAKPKHTPSYERHTPSPSATRGSSAASPEASLGESEARKVVPAAEIISRPEAEGGSDNPADRTIGDEPAPTSVDRRAGVSRYDNSRSEGGKAVALIGDVVPPDHTPDNPPETTNGNTATNDGSNRDGRKLFTQESSAAISDSVIMEKPKAVASVVSGQNEKNEQKKKKEKRIFHADVYANLTPSLSFQKITPSGNDELRVIGLQSDGVMSGNRFGISLEAGFQRKLTPRLDFYVGLSYYRQKQKLTYEYNGSGVTIDQGGDGGYSITPVKESKSFQYNMTNAGISAGVMYHLFGDKLMHKIGGGLQFQKGLLRMGAESSYNNAASFYFNYQLSYRMEVQLNKKWNVYLQPTFIHSIIANEELSEPFTIKPYRAGLGVGAIYHF